MHPYTLWPGLSKPGLWMYFVSKLGRLASTCPISTQPPVFNCGQFLLDRGVSGPFSINESVMISSTDPIMTDRDADL